MGYDSNFKKNCLKGFSSKSQQEVLLKAVENIIYSKSMRTFEAAKREYIEIAQFSCKTNKLLTILISELLLP